MAEYQPYIGAAVASSGRCWNLAELWLDGRTKGARNLGAKEAPEACGELERVHTILRVGVELLGGGLWGWWADPTDVDNCMALMT